MEYKTDVSDEEVRSLTQSILLRYGVDFTGYEPKSLRRRIVRILNLYSFGSIFELWSRLLKDPSFIYIFMNEISVGMTSMFRDPILWRTLRQKLKTDYANKDGIRIWHAGCSTGEEVYSMGILFKEVALNTKYTALATDISQESIQTARKGVYHKLKMLENESNYRLYNPAGDFSQYCSTSGQDAVMNHALVDHCDFQYHNLITDPVQGRYDIIFCRNVMIYFDTAAKEKLLDKFYDALKPGGYLIIGFYDTMLSIINQQKLKIADEEAKIFCRCV